MSTVVVLETVQTVIEVARPNVPAVVSVGPLRQSVEVDRTNVIVAEVPIGPKGDHGDPGPRGLTGPAGASGVEVYGFSFGDATPTTILTLPRHAVGCRVELVITTPFNGAGSAIAVGTTADPQLILPAGYNLPAEEGSYERDAVVDLVAGTGIVLVITPGFGTSAGAGYVVLEPLYMES